MAKKDPSYEMGWHTTGTLKVLPGIDQMAQRMEANKFVEMHGLNVTKALDGWWSYDAVWYTADGARVRGRLNLHNQHPGKPVDPKLRDMDPGEYDPETAPLSGYFHAFAEANRPWNPAWPSPLAVFLDRKSNPSYASVAYIGHNVLHTGHTNLAGLMAALAEMPWVATVLTHEDFSPDIFDKSGRELPMPLISRLPASLYGRVIDMRVMGESTRRKINRILTRYGTQLPKGGAAILLAPERRKGVSSSDLTFPMDRPFAEGGDIAPLAAVLSRMLSEQVMKTDSDAIEELREHWLLLTDEEEEQRDAALLRGTLDRVEELEQQNADLLVALESSHQLNQRFKETGDALIQRANEAFGREQKAVEKEKKLRKELDRLLRMIRDSDMGKAREAQKAAEDEAEAAEELLDEQNQELTSLRQENARLRRELARLGSTFTMVVAETEEEAEPANWDEFFARSSALEYVVLGSVESEVDKLRGQDQERTWIRRSWEALRALEEYARLKKERGAEQMPHFHAYLLDPHAEHALPRTRYSGNESQAVMMNSRFAAARTLPVPRQVDESGRILMEAHIRIGSGKPPAPRMHFYDDTNGPTGKIYVGHLGPHLPNYQTN